MLERLLGSNIRIKLLKLFLLQPEARFSLVQICRDLKLKARSVKNELENLEKLGIIKYSDRRTAELAAVSGEPVKEKKYFYADTGFSLFEEIKALIVKSQIFYERDFIDQLKRVGKIKLVVLTGIFVGNLNSPVDLLVVGRFSRGKLSKLIRDLERDLGREINYTFLNTQEFIYRRNITDVFLYQILEGKNIVLINEVGL